MVTINPKDCDQVAGRLVPMLAGAFNEGLTIGICAQSYTPNPYETEEDRHVDQ